MLTNDAPDQNQEIDVDSLLAEIEKPADPRAMDSPEQPTEAPEQPQEAKPWEPPEWSHFEWNGKKLFPDSPDKAKQWLSMGYNYSQRMGELNKQHAERLAQIEKQQKEWEAEQKRLSPYREVDQYAAQNKEWWDFVQQQYQERAQWRASQGLPPELQQQLAPVLGELNELKSWKQTWEQQQAEIAQRQQEEEYQRQDQALDAEIKSLQEQFPNYDFSAVDPATGQTLELAILKHAEAHGIPTFKAAVWDYLGPKLIVDAKANGQVQAAKQVQAKAKAGIIGQTPTPTKVVQPAQNLKAKSYNDLRDEALREFGIIS
jgi:hypothetical protein